MGSDKENIFCQKAMYYCGYQERTEKEVHAKLRTWGVAQEKVVHIIQILKAENFLNDERYVASFIRGKLRDKRWGKRKLLAVLTEKGLDPILIQEGLAAIEDMDYLQNLHYVADRKKRALVGVTSAQARQKLTNYLLQKGYEPDLVIQVVQETIVS